MMSSDFISQANFFFLFAVVLLYNLHKREPNGFHFTAANMHLRNLSAMVSHSAQQLNLYENITLHMSAQFVYHEVILLLS